MAEIYGTSNDDILNGTSDDDYIVGGAGNDALMGGAGHDTLQGDAGDDVLNGGSGNDQLWGDSGNDTYIFGVGSGTDTVQDWGGFNDVDTVFVTSGVTPATLFVTQDWAVNGGAVTLRLAQSDDQFIIQNGTSMEQIQFADGTVWDQAMIQGRLQQGQTGTAGNDHLSGFAFNNYLDGQAGDDILYGNSGIDALLGGSGNDQLYGGAGDDVLDGGSGNDQLYGDMGSDTYMFGVGSGTDIVQDGGGDVMDVDTVYVTSGVTPVTLLITQDFAQNLGAVTLRLVHSDDQLVIQNSNSIEQIQFADGTVWDQAMIQARLQQGQTGTAGNDSLGGGSHGDYLQGLAGDDFLYGGDGQDALLGGSGNDQLYGGMGDDVLNGGSGNDQLYGDSGNDTYIFGVGSGTDTVQDWGGFNEVDTVLVTSGVTPATLFVTQDWAVNAGAVTLRLAQSDDQFIIQNGTSMEQIQFADGTVWDQAMIQGRLQQGQTGTAGNDSLGGGSHGDYLQGLAGDDFLYGGDGQDALLGGSGNDQLYGGMGDDVLNGGSGNDQLYGDSGNDTYIFGVGSGTDTVQDWGAINDVDTVFVTSGVTPATLFVTQDWAVNGGAVTLRLAQSDDQFIIQNGTSMEQIQFADGTVWDQAMIQGRLQQGQTGTAGNDHLSGFAFNNYLDGQAGDDILYGNSGIDALLGGSGNDQLYGGAGDDVLNGGSGNDQLYGDGGNDTYIFGVGSGVDTVQDWGGFNDVDTVFVTSGVTPATLFVTQDWAVNGGAVTLRLAQSDDQFIIQNGTSMEQIQFADGTVWDQAMIQGRLQQGQTGTAGNDSLGGGSQGDYLQGLAGDDFLYGGDGQDALMGGAGHDTLQGDAGDDVLNGGMGNDLLQDWSGNDTYVWGVGSGTDTVQDWGAINDVDTVFVTSGVTPATLFVTQDWVTNPGGLILRLAQSDDQFIIQNGTSMEQIQFADGTVWDSSAIQLRLQQSMTGAEGDDYLWGTADPNYMQGLGGNDHLYGQDGNDVLLGGAGDDYLEGGQGDDTMSGGQGNDTYLADQVGDVVTEGINEGTDTVMASINYSLGANVENLTLTGGATDGTGNDLNNVLIGNTQNNRLDGGLGADSMIGGAGDDTYVVDHAGDSVVEAAGDGMDLVQASASHTLSSNAEDLILTGEAAIDGTGNDLNNTLIGNSGANRLDGAAGADTMEGGAGDDLYVVDDVGDTVTETANEGLDTVQSSITYTLGANVENLTLTGTSAINGTGNALDNVLTGNSAANVLTGGAGDDTYIIEAGDSVVEAAGGGTDTVHSAMTYTLGAHVENLTLTGSSAINGTGNSLDNVLVGNSAANTLTGGDGDDTYVVGAGDTVVESKNSGTDTVHSSVTWTLGSNLENLTLLGSAAINGTGNSGANLMIGNDAANELSGEKGNDILRGNAGNDTVNGGGGNDTYLFGRGEGQDLLQDNGGSSDKIMYDTGIDPIDLVISRQANDLRLAIHGSADYVTVQNWYTSSSNRTETIQAGNGQTLLSTQVDQLIQAMASFTQQTGLTWDQAIDQQPQDVQNILAANWQ